MICNKCRGTGWLGFASPIPCDLCIGGIASCCDGSVSTMSGDNTMNEMISLRALTALVLLYRNCGDPRIRRRVLSLIPELADFIPDLNDTDMAFSNKQREKRT